MNLLAAELPDAVAVAGHLDDRLRRCAVDLLRAAQAVLSGVCELDIYKQHYAWKELVGAVALAASRVGHHGASIDDARLLYVHALCVAVRDQDTLLALSAEDADEAGRAVDEHVTAAEQAQKAGRVADARESYKRAAVIEEACARACTSGLRDTLRVSAVTLWAHANETAAVQRLTNEWLADNTLSSDARAELEARA